MGHAMRPVPSLGEESRLWSRGVNLVAGVDEVGRGPLAGPVVAAAVILPPGADFGWLVRVRDSKQLSPTRRGQLAGCIWRDALAVGVGFVSHTAIDRLGIVKATHEAMLRAVGELSQTPQHLLIDALTLPAWTSPQTGIIAGDARCTSIAAASIVAKVARDQHMQAQDHRFSGYGFLRNKGYPTPQHLEALNRLGPCEIHRRSFAPVRHLLTPHTGG